MEHRGVTLPIQPEPSLAADVEVQRRRVYLIIVLAAEHCPNSGVPFFVVSGDGDVGRRTISGAVPADDFLRAFADASADRL